MRLARAICSDVSLYNEEKIVRSLEQDSFFDALREELEEGRELYRSRVSPGLYGRTNYYDRAIVDVILRPKGHVKTRIARSVPLPRPRPAPARRRARAGRRPAGQAGREAAGQRADRGGDPGRRALWGSSRRISRFPSSTRTRICWSSTSVPAWWSTRAGTPHSTVVNALLHRLGGAGAGGDRPGLVHRLDKDTSGCLVVARTEAALLDLQSQFQGRSVEKVYLALVHGRPPDEGRLETPYGRHPRDRKRFTSRAGSRRAITSWRVEERFGDRASLVEVRRSRPAAPTRSASISPRRGTRSLPMPPTAARGGRPGSTPTIRSGRPAPPWGRQALHAWKLAFHHPRTGRLRGSRPRSRRTGGRHRDPPEGCGGRLAGAGSRLEAAHGVPCAPGAGIDRQADLLEGSFGFAIGVASAGEAGPGGLAPVLQPGLPGSRGPHVLERADRAPGREHPEHLRRGSSGGDRRSTGRARSRWCRTNRPGREAPRHGPGRAWLRGNGDARGPGSPRRGRCRTHGSRPGAGAGSARSRTRGRASVPEPHGPARRARARGRASPGRPWPCRTARGSARRLARESPSPGSPVPAGRRGGRSARPGPRVPGGFPVPRSGLRAGPRSGRRCGRSRSGGR